MNIKIVVCLSVASLVITLITNIITIILNLLNSRRYYRAKSGIKNVDFPSTVGFSNNDLSVDEKFCEKFRGSVRLGSLKIFTDEQIEEKRKKAKLPLP